MSSEAAFYRRAEEMLFQILELNPVAATETGELRWTVDVLVRECQLEPANALAEVARYNVADPAAVIPDGQKLAITALVGEYRRAHSELPLGRIHDAILGCGSLPRRLMRRQLGL